MAARKRIDPKSRPADGRRNYDGVINADPSRKYVWVNPNDEATGVSAYEGMGYVLERKREGGPRAAVGKAVAEGEVVTSMGQYLMSCPLEDFEAETAAGQLRADALDRRILKDGGIEDGLRGQGFRMGVDRNPDITSAPYTEIEQGA